MNTQPRKVRHTQNDNHTILTQRNKHNQTYSVIERGKNTQRGNQIDTQIHTQTQTRIHVKSDAQAHKHTQTHTHIVRHIGMEKGIKPSKRKTHVQTKTT